MKDTLLGAVKQQLKEDALKDMAAGKLTSPADLDEICGRLIPRLRNNPVTGNMLKLFKVLDDDLRKLFKDVLDDIGIDILETNKEEKG